MISGDNFYTAVHCAKLAGIITEDEVRSKDVCMNGKDFREKVGVVKKIRERDGEVKWEIANK
jgi:magnesium-transporting ATPase (P-type)